MGNKQLEPNRLNKTNASTQKIIKGSQVPINHINAIKAVDVLVIFLVARLSALVLESTGCPQQRCSWKKWEHSQL